jgi:hypothetical protein
MAKVSRFPLDQVVKILMLIVCLVAIVALRKACAHGVVNLFETLAPTPPPDASPGRSSPAPSPTPETSR